jgi:hypothetical protein
MIEDPTTWKLMFDTIRSAIGLVRDANEISGGSEQQKQVVTQALATASSSTAIAEAEISKGLGYQLCKCDFPPTIMKTVGYFSRTLDDQHKDGDPVFECPKCGYNNAGGWAFTRLAPKA